MGSDCSLCLSPDHGGESWPPRERGGREPSIFPLVWQHDAGWPLADPALTEGTAAWTDACLQALRELYRAPPGDWGTEPSLPPEYLTLWCGRVRKGTHYVGANRPLSPEWFVYHLLLVVVLRNENDQRHLQAVAVVADVDEPAVLNNLLFRWNCNTARRDGFPIAEEWGRGVGPGEAHADRRRSTTGDMHTGIVVVDDDAFPPPRAEGLGGDVDTSDHEEPLDAVDPGGASHAPPGARRVRERTVPGANEETFHHVVHLRRGNQVTSVTHRSTQDAAAAAERRPVLAPEVRTTAAGSEPPPRPPASSAQSWHTPRQRAVEGAPPPEPIGNGGGDHERQHNSSPPSTPGRPEEHVPEPPNNHHPVVVESVAAPPTRSTLATTPRHTPPDPVASRPHVPGTATDDDTAAHQRTDGDERRAHSHAVDMQGDDGLAQVGAPSVPEWPPRASVPTTTMATPEAPLPPRTPLAGVHGPQAPPPMDTTPRATWTVWKALQPRLVGNKDKENKDPERNRSTDPPGPPTAASRVSGPQGEEGFGVGLPDGVWREAERHLATAGNLVAPAKTGPGTAAADVEPEIPAQDAASPPQPSRAVGGVQPEGGRERVPGQQGTLLQRLLVLAPPNITPDGGSRSTTGERPAATSRGPPPPLASGRPDVWWGGSPSPTTPGPVGGGGDRGRPSPSATPAPTGPERVGNRQPLSPLQAPTPPPEAVASGHPDPGTPALGAEAPATPGRTGGPLQGGQRDHGGSRGAVPSPRGGPVGPDVVTAAPEAELERVAEDVWTTVTRPYDIACDAEGSVCVVRRFPEGGPPDLAALRVALGRLSLRHLRRKRLWNYNLFVDPPVALLLRGLVSAYNDVAGSSRLPAGNAYAVAPGQFTNPVQRFRQAIFDAVATPGGGDGHRPPSFWATTRHTLAYRLVMRSPLHRVQLMWLAVQTEFDLLWALHFLDDVEDNPAATIPRPRQATALPHTVRDLGGPPDAPTVFLLRSNDHWRELLLRERQGDGRGSVWEDENLRQQRLVGAAERIRDRFHIPSSYQPLWDLTMMRITVYPLALLAQRPCVAPGEDLRRLGAQHLSLDTLLTHGLWPRYDPLRVPTDGVVVDDDGNGRVAPNLAFPHDGGDLSPVQACWLSSETGRHGRYLTHRSDLCAALEEFNMLEWYKTFHERAMGVDAPADTPERTVLDNRVPNVSGRPPPVAADLLLRVHLPLSPAERRLATLQHAVLGEEGGRFDILRSCRKRRAPLLATTWGSLACPGVDEDDRPRSKCARHR